MMNFNDVLQDFCRWMNDDCELTIDSVRSYMSYVKGLSNAVDRELGQGWFERLMIDDADGLSREKRWTCSRFIRAKINGNAMEPQKTWRNWQSGYHKFEEFLDCAEGFDGVEEKNISEEPSIATSIDSAAKDHKENAPRDPAVESLNPTDDGVVDSLSHDSLLSRFRNRLITQRRMYPGIHVDGAPCGLLFTPKLIGKIFGRGRHNIWNMWLRDGIENIRVLCSDAGQWVPFSHISRIDIHVDCRMLAVNNDGTPFELRTRTHDNNIMTEQFVLRTRGQAILNWKDITIDHVRPFENVLREYADQLTGLGLLSKKFAEFNEDHGWMLDGRKDNWVNELYDRYRGELDTDDMRTKLANDLGCLCERGGGYELMDTRENSKKGKGV